MQLTSTEKIKYDFFLNEGIEKESYLLWEISWIFE